MKKIILYCFSILLSLPLSAQKSNIEATFNRYIEATHANDVGAQLDFFYPQIFDYFPREAMLEGLKKTRENGKISLSNERLSSLSDIQEASGDQYALLTYQVDLTLNVADIKNREGNKEAIANMKSDYEKQHGPENVKFDEESYVFTITFTNTLYAVLDKRIGNWKFIPKDQTTRMVVEEVIPEGVRAKLE